MIIIYLMLIIEFRVIY